MNLDALNAILVKADKLRPIQALALQVLKTAGDVDASITEIVNIVKLDDVLTLKILKYSNSALYNRGNSEIKSVDEALKRLGLNALIKIVLASASSSYFDNAGEGYGLSRGELWRHSVASAGVSQRLAEFTGFPEKEALFTSCILHDIGKTVLDVFIAGKRDEIKLSFSKGNTVFTKVEVDILGLDHAALGGKILDKWAVPSQIADAVRWHHDPEKLGASSDLAWHVHISDLLCLMVGVGLGVDGLSYEGKTDRFAKYGIKEGDLQRLLIIAVEELERANQWLEGA
ncbi:MAG: HDOD domain-containing protein [Fibrobacteres bacterium]|nr:HDOD domain-containing protein [Fibrobacterota bacterium]